MKRIFALLFCVLFAALLLIRPTEASAAVADGLHLCARSVVPSLFPFLTVTAFLLQLGLDRCIRPLLAPLMRPLFRMRGECAAPLLVGFLGGYPTGARASAQLYAQGVLSRAEAERLLGFCNNCGPGFLVGFVGAGVLGSVRAGAALLAVHIVSALLTGVILCRAAGGEGLPVLPCNLPGKPISVAKALTESVSGAVAATLSICAYVVLFRTGAAVTGARLPAVLLGSVEMVGGLAALPADGTAFVAAAAITAWGGVSVHCQTMSVTGELSLKYHTMGKLIHTVLATVLAAAAQGMVQ